jgi:ABC-type phosphate transport system permease subunit
LFFSIKLVLIHPHRPEYLHPQTKPEATATNILTTTTTEATTTTTTTAATTKRKEDHKYMARNPICSPLYVTILSLFLFFQLACDASILITQTISIHRMKKKLQHQ